MTICEAEFFEGKCKYEDVPYIGGFFLGCERDCPEENALWAPFSLLPFPSYFHNHGECYSSNIQSVLGEWKAPESFQPEAVGTQEDPTSPFA